MLHHKISEQNLVLERKIQERTEQLYQTQKDVIQRLSRAVEYRDSETGSHTMRITQYAFDLSEAVGLSPIECEMM